MKVGNISLEQVWNNLENKFKSIRVSQKFFNILVVHKAQFGRSWCFCRGCKCDESFWTVRYRVIHSGFA